MFLRSELEGTPRMPSSCLLIQQKRKSKLGREVSWVPKDSKVRNRSLPLYKAHSFNPASVTLCSFRQQGVICPWEKTSKTELWKRKKPKILPVGQSFITHTSITSMHASKPSPSWFVSSDVTIWGNDGFPKYTLYRTKQHFRLFTLNLCLSTSEKSLVIY